MRVAVFGAGYVGLVTGACFADLGHDVVVRDVVAEKIDALRARRGADPRGRGSRRSSSGTASGCASRPTSARRSRAPTSSTSPSARRRRYSGDADLSAVWTVVDELPQVDRRIVVAMKSTVPVGTGRAVRHRLDDRGLANVGYVSNPEFTAEGTAVRDFMQPDRIVIGAFDAADGDVVEQLHDGHRRADRPLRRRVGGDDQARRERRARDAHLLHQRDRERLRGDGRRRRRRSPRASASTAGSARPSSARASASAARCFPKDSLALKQLAANSGYNFQLLNAVIEVNELQKRRVDREARAAARPAARQADRAPRPRVQAGHRRHARGAEPRARRPAARRGRRGERLGPGRGRRAHLDGVEIADSALEALDGADAAVLVTEWPELRELDWAAAGERMRSRVIVDGRNLLDPEALRAHGFAYEGIGRAVGVSLPAVILVGGQGTRLRPLTDRTRKDMLPLVDRPLLAYTFEHLARHGVERAIVSCGYLPDQIEAHFGDAYGELALEYAVEDEPLGTGGGDRLRRPRARGELLRAERRLAARGRPRRAGRASIARRARRRRSC